jgi:hypothetical protein
VWHAVIALDADAESVSLRWPVVTVPEQHHLVCGGKG